MIIAAEHAEGEGVGAGEDVEERFFLDGVAGEDADVAEGDEEGAVVVEANAADAVAAGLDQAAMAAGEAADVGGAFAFDESFGGGSGELVEGLFERIDSLFLIGEWEGQGHYFANAFYALGCGGFKGNLVVAPAWKVLPMSPNTCYLCVRTASEGMILSCSRSLDGNLRSALTRASLALSRRSERGENARPLPDLPREGKKGVKELPCRMGKSGIIALKDCSYGYRSTAEFKEIR